MDVSVAVSVVAVALVAVAVAIAVEDALRAQTAIQKKMTTQLRCWRAKMMIHSATQGSECSVRSPRKTSCKERLRVFCRDRHEHVRSSENKVEQHAKKGIAPARCSSTKPQSFAPAPVAPSVPLEAVVPAPPTVAEAPRRSHLQK